MREPCAIHDLGDAKPLRALRAQQSRGGRQDGLPVYFPSKEHGAEGFAPFVSGYLSTRHLDEVEAGCPIAATLSDVPRQPQAVRRAFAEGVKAYLEAASTGQNRQTAIARLAGMIGALALARAVAPEDRALAEEILQAARQIEGAP